MFKKIMENTKKNKFLSFIKSEIILTVAWILAIASMFFVHPDKKYLNYIDWNSLGILWSLMVIMNAFRENGFFDLLARKLLSSIKKSWALIGTLVFLCFISSMAITNDVALITFVPFAILLLGESKLLIPTIVLQTLAANLGSMITPIGNPQNLYLFALGNFGIWDFIKILLPYWIASLILLVAGVFIFSRNCKSIQTPDFSDNQKKLPPLKTVLFTILFILSILTVLKFVPCYVLAIAVFVVAIIFQNKAILKADYFLLLTFIGFFIFTGNMARIPAINNALASVVNGKEFFLGVAASQIISNVPAALLLSGFTKNLSQLVLGVDIGGLGTLIASMASLISFKFYCKTKNAKSGKYLLCFTVANVIFLVFMIALWFVFK